MNRQQWKGISEKNKEMGQRKLWKDGDRHVQCVSQIDYASGSMLLWDICNNVKFNFRLTNKVLCIILKR